MFSTELSKQVIGKHSAFDPTKSATFKEVQGAQWKITYGDGSGAAGIVGTDVVTIGGVKVENQTVELANQVSQSFVEDINTDGLVGLAFSKLNTGEFWLYALFQLDSNVEKQSTMAYRRLLKRHSSTM